MVALLLWGGLSYRNLLNYRSPIRAMPLPIQEDLPSQTGKVVLVIVSGLRVTDVDDFDLPNLSRLQQAGASIIVESQAPTYEQTAWATIVTGAWPEINDAPAVDLAAENVWPLEIDTVFARAHEAGLQTALLGSLAWRNLILADHLDYRLVVEDNDTALMEAALPLVSDDNTELVLIHLNRLKSVVEREGGTDSDIYQEAAAQLDENVGQIMQALDLSHGVLMVTADHGFTASGGYGGDELEIKQQPLFIIGQGVEVGEYTGARQVDIAPTIAALLGTALPVTSQGAVLFELLQLNRADRAVIQLQQAGQRVELLEAYLSLFHGQYLSAPDPIITDLARARTVFNQGNLSGTFELAALIQQQVDEEMLLTRNNFAAQAKQRRLIFVLIVGLLFCWLLWQLRRSQISLIITAALVTILLYHGLYRLQGYSYSLSAIQDFADLPWDVLRRIIVSTLVGSGLLILMLTTLDEDDGIVLLGIGYRFCILTIGLFAVPALWAFWQNGLGPVFILPDSQPAFWQVMSTLELVTLAALSLVIPWPVMTVSLFVTRMRYRLVTQYR